MIWLATVFVFVVLFVLLFLFTDYFIQKILLDIVRLEQRVTQIEVNNKKRNDMMTTGRFR